MKIYHNPRCSKSRQTLDIIISKNTDVEIIDYLTAIPTHQELKKIISMLDIRPYDLLRKGEKDFKENFKGKTLNDTQCIEAMIKYPKLIERPIVINGNKAVLGRPPEKVLELL